jgi:hypothetical protein
VKGSESWLMFPGVLGGGGGGDWGAIAFSARMLGDCALVESIGCSDGWGIAVCAGLGILAISANHDAPVRVYSMPHYASPVWWTAGRKLVLLKSLRVSKLRAACRHHRPLYPGEPFTALAFTDGTVGPCLLLVGDNACPAVSVIDARSGAHVGFVAGPGQCDRTRGIATWGSLACISSWAFRGLGEPTVRLYEGNGPCWAPLRTLSTGLEAPMGLRFTQNGTRVVVVESGRGHLAVIDVADGACVSHLSTPFVPFHPDVEEWDGGWLVTNRDVLQFVGMDGTPCESSKPRGREPGGFMRPRGLAAVPGVGFAVRGSDAVHVYASRDALAMAAMSPARVAWMTVAARGRLAPGA